MNAPRLLIGIGLWAFLISETCAAPEEYCRQYAEKAAWQYQQAIRHNVPNIGPPAWSSDYNGHKAWCLLVDPSIAEGETRKRDRTLAPYLAGQPPPAPPPAGGQSATMTQPMLPVAPQQPTSPGGKTATMDGPMLQADDACTRYAREAVYHQQLNQQHACGFQGPRWDSGQPYHENWCRREQNMDRPMAEHKARVEMLVKCQTPSSSGAAAPPPPPSGDPRKVEPLLVPGLTLALWHGNCGWFYDNPSQQSQPVSVDQVWIGSRLQEKQGQTKDVQVLCTEDLYDRDRDGGDPYVGLGWVTVEDVPADVSILRKLPPGLVLGLSADFYYQFRTPNSMTSPTVFGETAPMHDITVAPAPLPGLKTYCSLDHTDRSGMDGVNNSCRRAWFETVNDPADVDWSLVDRLPRYTVVGLKYTSNDDGNWLGNQRWKRLQWMGPGGSGMKLYDPACRTCTPPPGFIRVEAGDRGAPAGQGYVWYMKVTGPDILKP